MNDMPEKDNTWEDGSLGVSESFVRKVPPEREKAVMLSQSKNPVPVNIPMMSILNSSKLFVIIECYWLYIIQSTKWEWNQILQARAR